MAIVLLIPGLAAAQVRPVSQFVGNWELSCPAVRTESCRLRHRTAVLPTGVGGPNAVLEVIHRGGVFIPAVALRGLSTQQAIGGMLAMQVNITLRFDDAPPMELNCGLDGGAIVCVPDARATANAADELPKARSTLIRVRLGLPGGTALPEQSRSLDLQGTADALAQFRATAPADGSVPVVAGLDWRGFLDRLARDAGFPNGLQDLATRSAALLH